VSLCPFFNVLLWIPPNPLHHLNVESHKNFYGSLTGGLQGATRLGQCTNRVCACSECSCRRCLSLKASQLCRRCEHACHRQRKREATMENENCTASDYCRCTGMCIAAQALWLVLSLTFSIFIPATECSCSFCRIYQLDATRSNRRNVLRHFSTTTLTGLLILLMLASLCLYYKVSSRHLMMVLWLLLLSAMFLSSVILYFRSRMKTKNK
jgi:hypothetical protein